MAKYWILAAAAAAFALGACQRREGWPRLELPPSLAGWRLSGPEFYNRKTLFQYIDGAAEVYLAYGFEQLAAFKLESPNGGWIVADIFRMSSPEEAFGIFSFEREGPDVGVGNQSEYSPGLLRFWQANYFVAVSAHPPQKAAELKDAAFEVAQAISSKLPRGGQPPLLARLLPQQGLDSLSVRYLHTHSCLNFHLFIASDNILGLGRDTDVVLARYSIDGGRAKLLVVKYPTASRAHRAAEELVSRVLEAQGAEALVQVEDGTWWANRHRGRLLLAVFDAPTRKAAQELLDRADAAFREVSGH